MPTRKRVKQSARKPSKRKASKAGLEASDSVAEHKSVASAGKNVPFRAKIRMYRQGLGDCFLLTFPREDNTPFYVLIDCGLILGASDAGLIMKEVAEHIVKTTGGHIHLVVATHEHWDHISGFGQAREIWTDKNRLTVDQVWLSWAEDPDHSLAQKLRGERQAMKLALRSATSRLFLAEDSSEASDLAELLGFFGARGSSADFLEIVKHLSDDLRYCTPQDDPIKLAGTDVRVYVLGPPPDEKLIKKYNPSKSTPETYGIGLNHYLKSLQPVLSDNDRENFFERRYRIPMHVAQQMTFFQQHYWEDDVDSPEKNQWRRIDTNWLDASSSLALQLDSATNNTCLVLAFELANGDVLLFPADAQVGNWLSWQALKWNVDGAEITGPDLLRRTIFYKVGHHGSHNATLRELGLEQMKSLKMAFVPVDHAMAVKKRWNRMPLNELMERLNVITEERVVRIDTEIPQKLSKNMVANKLFHEVVL